MTQIKHVRIVEVGPRDGLQNEKAVIPVADKITFINMLSQSGLQAIEVGAFVSPKWVPQMADSDKVFAGIDKRAGISYPVLVPNDKGMDAAMAAGVGEIAIFAAASESFSRKNINCTIDESFARFAPVIERARANNIRVRGYVSCVLGCPYEGAVDPAAVARVAKRLLDAGCYEVSLGDTIGIGTPESTRAMLDVVTRVVPVEKIAVHFHDTNARAIENIAVALEYGINVIDSAAGGLGGCPYAPGAAGNVATEKVLDYLTRAGIGSGVDAAAVAAASAYIQARIAANLLAHKEENGAVIPDSHAKSQAQPVDKNLKNK